MRHFQYGVLAFCFFAVACAGGGTSAPTSPSSAIGGATATAATGASELPFRGTLAATETEDGSLHHLVGTGNATHLGRFTLTSDFTVTTTATASGTAVWTAANGDQLFTTVTGVAIVTFPTAAISETHTITGGTGRFADASGSISIERSLNLPTLVSSGSITGTIDLSH